MTTTSRAAVRIAVAQFFGGTTYDSTARAYRGSGPLLSNGLSTVRAYQSKRINDMDYVQGQAAGRGMGAAMVIEMNETRNNTLTVGQKPTLGGQRHLVYPVQCHFFHMAHQNYAEDAEADVDALAEAVQDLIYTDFTLGTGGTSPPMIYQAGIDSAGIRTLIDPSQMAKEITVTHFRVNFNAEVQIVV